MGSVLTVNAISKKYKKHMTVNFFTFAHTHIRLLGIGTKIRKIRRSTPVLGQLRRISQVSIVDLAA